jgi:molecular chaperone DnaK
MGKTKPIGIDLGTTNSSVAWVDHTGRTAMVPNAEGDLLTPSVVLFDDNEVVVGKEARAATVVHPEKVAECVKRDMGAPVYSRPIRGEYLPPEVIQACILRKLKADVLHTLGPDTSAVITVPAYFDEPRRKATADAGEMAGMTVLDIVNEPTAAALAYGEMAGFLSATGAPKHEMTVMVYDLGGGTFDVTLLHLAPGNIRTIATDGDVQLGGHDWDLRLANYVAETFKATYGVDPRETPAGFNRLLAAVVEAKHTLSARSKVTIRVEHAGVVGEIQVNREKFEELTGDLLERTSYTCRQLIATARMDWRNVNRLLLVGGSTRMPMVSAMLQKLTGFPPDHTVNPDEAVARGAALYSSYLLAKRAEGGSQATFEVTNVNAHSLGIEGIDPDTLRKTNVVLIPRNTPLPARFTEKFVTKSEGQRSIVIQVLEGESSLPSECTAIGRTVIRDLPAGLPKGWPVEVAFEYGTNGRLGVRAVVPGTHREVELSLERDAGMSREGIARWRQMVSASPGFSSFETLLQDVLGLGPPPAAPGQTPNQTPGTAPLQPGRWEAGPQPLGLPAGAAPASQPMIAYGQPAPLAPQPAASGSQPAPLSSQPMPPASQPAPLASPMTAAYSPSPAGAATATWGAAAGMTPGGPGHQPTAAGPPPPPEPPPAPGQAAEYTRAPVAGVRRPPRWVINLIGHIVASVVGLGMGYLVLNWLQPGRFPLPW